MSHHFCRDGSRNCDVSAPCSHLQTTHHVHLIEYEDSVIETIDTIVVSHAPTMLLTFSLYILAKSNIHNRNPNCPPLFFYFSSQAIPSKPRGLGYEFEKANEALSLSLTSSQHTKPRTDRTLHTQPSPNSSSTSPLLPVSIHTHTQAS